MGLRSVLFLIILLSGSVCAGSPPDVIFKSRFDLASSKTLITQLRNFLMQSGFGDPFKQRFERPITIDLSTGLSDMPPEAQNWVHELQSVLRLKLFESDYKMVIEGLKYAVLDYNTDFIPIVGAARNRVEYVTKHHVHGLNIGADNLSFNVELKQTQSGKPIRFKVELIGVSFDVHPDLLLELPMKWGTDLFDDKLELSLNSVNLRHILDVALKNPHLIRFHTMELKLPEVSIRVGGKVITLDQEKLKAFFRDHQDALKLGVLNVVKSKLGHLLPNVMGETPKKVALPRSYAVNGLISMIFKFDEIRATTVNMLELALSGKFCEMGHALLPDKCLSREIISRRRREITSDMSDRSSRALNRLLVEDSANIAVSISENFVNQLVLATVKSGLWEEPLKGKDFRLGKEGAFILAEDKGEFFSLFLDIIYTLKGRDRVLVGASELNFPVKFKIALKVGNKNEVPHFKIIVQEVVSNRESLLAGYPQYGLPSSLDLVPRFREKVLQKIMQELKTFEKEEMISVDLPELKDTYFDRLTFFSDGIGRANASLNFR